MIKGIMIDCSRLMERREYYYELVDFMAQWRLNTLVLHFSDDFGCAVELPGFEYLAMPGAFTAAEIRKLIRYAARKGIDIIPELETFGHTRFITDHPRHQELFAGEKTRELKYCAVDPLNPRTFTLMEGLVRATARLFPSRYLHIGCDEVNMKEYCEKRGLDEAETWTGYVNRIIGMVRACGKAPLMWSDHPKKNPRIAAGLRKDVIAVGGGYRPGVTDGPIKVLRKIGFEQVLLAPSIACACTQTLVTKLNLENTRRLCAFSRKHKVAGLINTVWCPWRYIQGTMYYGIAFTGALLQEGGRFDRKAFHREFAWKVFGLEPGADLERFLSKAPEMHLQQGVYSNLYRQKHEFTAVGRAQLESANRLGPELLALAARIKPQKNAHILEAMALGVKCVWVCSEAALLGLRGGTAARKAHYNRMLREVCRAASADWDRTRNPRDPQKLKALFPNGADRYLLLILHRLQPAGRKESRRSLRAAFPSRR